MTWLCGAMAPLAPHIDLLSQAAFAALVITALVQFVAVLPAFYAYQGKVYGSQAAYDLHWVSSADLRQAGMGWAVAFRRVSSTAVALMFAPVALRPSMCS
jgi:hypothetical protein